MYNRILAFINKHNLLYKFQFGFCGKHGTDNVLIVLVDKIMSAFNDVEMVLGVFVDLSKAFDTVDHDILLNKLDTYGIRGTTHDWFRSYLFQRKQFVAFNGSTSNESTIKCLVPQGSILGPLLFHCILMIWSMHQLYCFHCYLQMTQMYLLLAKIYRTLWNLRILS